MKTAFYTAVLLLMASVCMAQSKADRLSLERTTTAIRDAFARGDVEAIVALHHPCCP
jgi:hypothetical protein